MPRTSFSEDAQAGPDRESGKKPPQTGRYDRKAIKARIDVESWMDEQLKDLFGVEDDSKIPEIDLDEVRDESNEEGQIKLVLNIVAGAPNKAKIPTFAKELVGRVNTLVKK